MNLKYSSFRSKAGLDNTQTELTVIHFTSPPAD